VVGSSPFCVTRITSSPSVPTITRLPEPSVDAHCMGRGVCPEGRGATFVSAKEVQLGFWENLKNWRS
jgi:hypothetical protein